MPELSWVVGARWDITGICAVYRLEDPRLVLSSLFTSAFWREGLDRLNMCVATIVSAIITFWRVCWWLTVSVVDWPSSGFLGVVFSPDELGDVLWFKRLKLRYMDLNACRGVVQRGVFGMHNPRVNVIDHIRNKLFFDMEA